jgi:hypothetical protein
MKFNPNKYKGVNKEGMKRQFERTKEHDNNREEYFPLVLRLSAPHLGTRSAVKRQNI